MLQFKKATKAQAKLRLAISGPSGAGKTYSALAIAAGLGSKVAVIDTERGSASLYADKFGFDVLELAEFSPLKYVEALSVAGREGYEVVVVDSLSHAWMGKGGALEQVDNAAKRGRGNSYTAWRDVTPQHNALVDALLGYPGHVIVTMRSKTEYTMEEINGKKVPKKVGLAPVQRDGVEYEFTLAGEMDLEHNFIISKTRCSALADAVIKFPGAHLAQTLKAWLEDGAPVATTPSPAPVGVSPPNGGAVSPASLEWSLKGSVIVERIKTIANPFEMANWKKKHVAELDEIKRNAPDVYAQIVEAGKAKNAEFQGEIRALKDEVRGQE